MNAEMTKYPDYQSERMARDEAWENDSKRDNLKLRDGDLVTLIHSTKGEGWFIPAGSTGVIVQARTPRVRKSKDCHSEYFANIAILAPTGSPVRARVPHSAIRL